MLIQFLFRLLSRLPLAWLHRIGGWAGWLAYLGSGRYRRHLRENLLRATGQDNRALRYAAIAEAGRQAFELPWLWLHPTETVIAKIIRVEGWEQVEAAQREGAGILFLTPHLGCFEITARYYAAHAPITVLYRAPRKKALEPLIQAGRTHGLMRMAPADLSGVRHLIKALRAHEAVGMLPDQVPAAGEGIWAPFFGQPAWTMTLAARLAQVKNVHTIYAWAERLPKGQGYILRLNAPTLPLPATLTLEEHCARINQELEHLILACPAQYLWGYHRYKQPRMSKSTPAVSTQEDTNAS